VPRKESRLKCFSSWPEELDDFHSDVKVVYLPPRTTTLLQPMDQGAIATFKAYCLRRMFSQAIKAIDSDEGITLHDFWKNYNILDAIKNIGVAWDEVKRTTMNAVWKKLPRNGAKSFKGRRADND
jgi:hypothetical protein